MPAPYGADARPLGCRGLPLPMPISALSDADGLARPKVCWQGGGVPASGRGLGAIKKVRIIANNQFGGFIMSDDLEYDAVPEPATLVAVGLGIAALAGRRRRA